MCIISTAQQARPNVIHISEPVRAQLISSSVAVTMKPLSASSLFDASEKRVVGPTGFAGARIENSCRRRCD